VSAVAAPYSPIHRAGDWHIVSGQLGLTDDGLPEGFAPQMRAMLGNFGRLLAEAGLRRDQVAKTTVFLTDMGDYAELNELYVEFFGEHRPARSAVAVAELPLGASVEMEAWVHAP
jgi:2-iminobutanoate/2-iminopropanoate deaminase